MENGKPPNGENEHAGAEGPYTLISPLHDARLESMAVRRGWIKPRWDMSKTQKDLDNGRDRSEMSLSDRTILAAHELLGGSERAKGIGARLAVTMEAQNQADEHKATPDQVNHLHAHVDVGEVLDQLQSDPAYVEASREKARERYKLNGNGKHPV